MTRWRCARARQLRCGPRRSRLREGLCCSARSCTCRAAPMSVSGKAATTASSAHWSIRAARGLRTAFPAERASKLVTFPGSDDGRAFDDQLPQRGIVLPVRRKSDVVNHHTQSGEGSTLFPAIPGEPRTLDPVFALVGNSHPVEGLSLVLRATHLLAFLR